MPSPFPGMDPYLEDPGIWPDVHHEVISEARALLGARLRPRYSVRIEERVYISDETDPGRRVIVPEDEIREAYLEIIDVEGRQVVTVIEVLSPSNKVVGSAGRASFERKRREVTTSSSHWVEVDLLRAGAGVTSRELLPPSEYLVHVSRVSQRPKGHLWPIRLSQRLPVIPIPLKEGDPDAPLDLQAVLTTAYDRAGYDLSLDYSREPTPPLPGEWASWADRLLKTRGPRSA